MTITLELSEVALAALKRRAAQDGVPPEEIAAEIIEQGLDVATEKPLTEREQIRAYLKEAGMLSEVSPELLKLYVTPHSDEELEAIMQELQQVSFSPTFSEMILEDRKLR